jgi:hypothetical protein
MMRMRIDLMAVVGWFMDTPEVGVVEVMEGPLEVFPWLDSARGMACWEERMLF